MVRSFLIVLICLLLSSSYVYAYEVEAQGGQVTQVHLPQDISSLKWEIFEGDIDPTISHVVASPSASITFTELLPLDPHIINTRWEFSSKDRDSAQHLFKQPFTFLGIESVGVDTTSLSTGVFSSKQEEILFVTQAQDAQYRLVAPQEETYYFYFLI